MIRVRVNDSEGITIFGMKILICAVLATAGALISPASVGQTPSAPASVSPTDPHIKILGQYDGTDPEHPRFGYPGSGFLLRFNGSELRVEVSSDSDSSALTVVVDHGVPELRLLRKGTNEVTLVHAPSPGRHTVEVYKRTETWQGIVTLLGVHLPDAGEPLLPSILPRRKLLFIGDSVTCGSGIENDADCKADPERPASDAYNAYGMLLGRRLDAQSHLVCYGGRGLERDYRGLGIADGVVNIPQFYQLAVASDEPSSRVPWDASRWQPDAIIVSLGTNDFNLQKTKPLDDKKWVSEYVAFVHALRKNYRHSFIFLTEGAIVTDPLLRQMVQETAAKVHDKKVKDVPSSHYPGLPCDAHPTRMEHGKIADDLEPLIRQTLDW